jgi:hypothetical protein
MAFQLYFDRPFSNALSPKNRVSVATLLKQFSSVETAAKSGAQQTTSTADSASGALVFVAVRREQVHVQSGQLESRSTEADLRHNESLVDRLTTAVTMTALRHQPLTLTLANAFYTRAVFRLFVVFARS